MMGSRPDVFKDIQGRIVIFVPLDMHMTPTMQLLIVTSVPLDMCGIVIVILVKNVYTEKHVIVVHPDKYGTLVM
tara:strand:- start:598 stop:819 length:222 start_codon:yes stop_codon:yes gene_type:complete